VNIGTFSYKTCLDYGLTGVLARSTGIKRDLRLDKIETYGNYYYLNFRGYVGQHGDSYDRFLIRMSEMIESLNIVNQVINKITKFNEIVNLNEEVILKNKINIQSKHITQNNPHILMKYLNPELFNNTT